MKCSINTEFKLGGAGKYMEIDETHIFKRKFNGGTILSS